MALANVALTDTFDTLRIRTNQIIVLAEQSNTNIFQFAINSNNAANSANIYGMVYANGSSNVLRSFANSVANSSNSYSAAYANVIGATSNAWANTVATAGNNYSIQVGAAANTWSNTLYVTALQNANNDANSSNSFAITVGAASNTWANAVGVAGNSYANAVGTAGNNYTNQVGAAANTWANGKVSSVTALAPLVSSGGVTPQISVNTSASMQIGGLGVGTAASANTGEIRATNNITAYYSDGRLKTIVSTIVSPVEKVRQLSGIIYINNEVAESFGYGDKSEQVGVIAQDVEKVLPQIVKLAPFDTEYVEGKEISKTGQNYKTVQYEKLIPLLIEAIKELSDEVELLKTKLGE